MKPFGSLSNGRVYYLTKQNKTSSALNINNVLKKRIREKFNCEGILHNRFGWEKFIEFVTVKEFCRSQGFTKAEVQQFLLD